MNKHAYTTALTKAKTISLSRQAKHQLDSAMQTLIQDQSDTLGETHAQFFFDPSMIYTKFAVGFAAIACVLVGGAGTVAAAEYSLPGDALYPVKIHITEQLVDTFATNASQKAIWQEEKTARRVAELQVLLAQDKLDDSQLTQSQVRISIYAQTLQSVLDQLEVEGNQEHAASLRTLLGAAPSGALLMDFAHNEGQLSPEVLQAIVAGGTSGEVGVNVTIDGTTTAELETLFGPSGTEIVDPADQEYTAKRYTLTESGEHLPLEDAEPDGDVSTKYWEQYTIEIE